MFRNCITGQLNFDLQVDAVYKSNFKHIYQEKLSGPILERATLEKSIKLIHECDTLVTMET